MDNENGIAEEGFKKYLLELGLLTEITPPVDTSVISEPRQPVPVVGNPVSELVMEERR